MERAADTPAPAGVAGQEHPEVSAAQGPEPDNEEEMAPRAQNPGFLERFMTKYDINAPTLMMMFK
jgi:hypothetical protein